MLICLEFYESPQTNFFENRSMKRVKQNLLFNEHA